MSLNERVTDLYKEKIAVNKRKSQHAKVDKGVLRNEISPDASFEQLVGLDDVKNCIMFGIESFKVGLEESADLGKPILICGSHGLGKTSLVRAAANHAKLDLFTFSLKSEIKQKRSQFEEDLRQLEINAKNIQPAIALIDDLDMLPDKEDIKFLVEATIERLLAEKKILVFCTTSAPLHTSTSIPFLREIQLTRPDYRTRLEILKRLTANRKTLSQLSNDILEQVALNTPSFTAVDLKDLLELARWESTSRGTSFPALEDCIAAINIVKQTFKKGTHLIGERPKVTWDDIGGMSEVRRAFIDILDQIRQGGHKFDGIALYGPPGCGKTMVAQAMANEGGFNFISIKPAELVDKYLGETEKNIRKVFQEARSYEPCIIYFDEFDGLCGTRSRRDTGHNGIQTLLSEMDGFIERGRSIILISTNRLEDIDVAMKRPGRLTRQIYIGPPDKVARQDILDKIMKRLDVSLDDDVNLEHWSGFTKGFTGADLNFLVKEAISRASRAPNSKLGHQHLTFALTRVKKYNREIAKKAQHSAKRLKTCS